MAAQTVDQFVEIEARLQIQLAVQRIDGQIVLMILVRRRHAAVARRFFDGLVGCHAVEAGAALNQRGIVPAGVFRQLGDGQIAQCPVNPCKAAYRNGIHIVQNDSKADRAFRRVLDFEWNRTQRRALCGKLRAELAEAILPVAVCDTRTCYFHRKRPPVP